MDIGCDQQRAMLFYCYCYGEAHQRRIMSVANNGCCVNTCISTKDFVKISRYVYHDATKIVGIDTPHVTDTYQLNRIIAQKSTNFCINQTLRPLFLREIPIHSAPFRLNQTSDVNYQIAQTEYQRLLYRTFSEKSTVTLPPPGFVNLPKKTSPLKLTEYSTREDDDLDVEKIIEEFKTKSKIHVDYEKRLILTRFFIMNLNSKVVKYVKDNNKVLELEEAMNCLKPEKLFVMPVKLLERLGFDAIFVDDEETTSGQAKMILNPKIRNDLAMEVVNNDAFANEVVKACNSRLDERGRMAYTKIFSSNC